MCLLRLTRNVMNMSFVTAGHGSTNVKIADHNFVCLKDLFTLGRLPSLINLVRNLN